MRIPGLLWGFATLLASVAASPAQGLSDTTPPTLIKLEVVDHPKVVDVSLGSATVRLRATIVDDLSGFTYGSIRFQSESGTKSLSGSFSQMASDPPDEYRGEIEVPRHAEQGKWTVTSVSLQDRTTNRQHYTLEDLNAIPGTQTTFRVTSDVDLQPPSVTAFEILTPRVDVSAASQTVQFKAKTTDDKSGVSQWPSLWIQGPTRHGRSASAAPQASCGTPPFIAECEWLGELRIPRYSEAGRWQAFYLSVVDKARNQRVITDFSGWNASVEVSSAQSDLVSPFLKSFALERKDHPVDTSASDQKIKMSLAFNDNLSGLSSSDGSWVSVQLRSPSGNQNASASLASAFPNGTSGVWDAEILFPRYSESGNWKVEYASIRDGAGNSSFYSAEELKNIATSGIEVIVIAPSGTPDGPAVSPTGGIVVDDDFGSRATVTVPPMALSQNTNIAIDVLDSPPNVPAPLGFKISSYFVNFDFDPKPTMPFPKPGLDVVLPLGDRHRPDDKLFLQRLDSSGRMVSVLDPDTKQPITCTVDSDGMKAICQGVRQFSTLIALLPSGAILGDVNGDGFVNCADWLVLRLTFGKQRVQTGFDGRADLNNDGRVNAIDLALLSRYLPANANCVAEYTQPRKTIR